jgi:hypothetical protein
MARASARSDVLARTCVTRNMLVNQSLDTKQILEYALLVEPMVEFLPA